MKLLVLEHESKLAEYLRKGLTEEGYLVDVANNGLDGLHLATQGDYSILLLDAVLPGINGLCLLAALRQSRQTPVLMLTARIGIEDRVRGLQAGADDYLVKPFAFSELVARVEALLRRSRIGLDRAPCTSLALSDLDIDLRRRRATRTGKPLKMTAKEFKLLALLMRRQGEVLSRTEISERVWDMNFDGGTNVVDVAVARLRSKLDLLFDRPLIHTVRCVGYLMEDRGR